MPHMITKTTFSPLFRNDTTAAMVCCLSQPATAPRRAPPLLLAPQNYEEALRIAETREREVRGYFDKFDLDGSDSIDMEVRSAPQCTARCFVVHCIAGCIAPCTAR